MVFASHGKALALIQHQNYNLTGLKLTDGSPAFHSRLNAHPNSMAASPDHARLVIGLISGDMEVYHSNNGLLIKRRRVASMPIAQVAYSAGSNLITLGGSASQSLAVSRTLHFFSSRRLRPHRQLPRHHRLHRPSAAQCESPQRSPPHAAIPAADLALPGPAAR